MSAYKKLSNSDVIVKPFTVKQSYAVSSSLFSSSQYNIDRFKGKNVDFFTDTVDVGNNLQEKQSLIYKSIRHLYYSNFLTSSQGDNAQERILIKGADETGDRFVGPIQTTNNINFLQSTLTQSRSLPLNENDEIFVLSIPSKLFGHAIEPGTFNLQSGSVILRDDFEGNITFGNSTVGNIIYTHGIIILTSEPSASVQNYGYGTSSYGTSSYGQPSGIYNYDTFLSGSYVCNFSASYDLQEINTKCTANASEFNYTYNKTILSDINNGQIKDLYTGSDARLYVTSVGLYNDDQELLAVAKIHRGIPKVSFTDTNFIIRLLL